MRIRVTTSANLFEKRKQEHIERGYRVEDERPIPVNGFCSFVAVRELSVSDRLGDLVAEAINRNHARPRGLVRCSMSLKVRFRFDGRCTRHPRYDPKRDGHPSDGKCEGCESLYVIHLYTKIAKRRAEDANLVVVRASSDREEHKINDRTEWL